MATPHLTRTNDRLVSITVGGATHLLTIRRSWSSKTFLFAPKVRKYANVVAYTVPNRGDTMYNCFKSLANKVNEIWNGMEVVNDWHRDTSGIYNRPPVPNYSRQCGDRAIFAYWSDRGGIYEDATNECAEIGCSRIFQQYDLSRIMLTGILVSNMTFSLRLWCGSHLVTCPVEFGGLARAPAYTMDGNGTMLMKIGNHTLTPDEVSNGYELDIMGGATNQGYHTYTGASWKGYGEVLPYWAWSDYGSGEGRVVVWTKGANRQNGVIDTDRYYYDMAITGDALTELRRTISANPADVCLAFGMKIGAGVADASKHYGDYSTQTNYFEKIELVAKAG